MCIFYWQSNSYEAQKKEERKALEEQKQGSVFYFFLKFCLSISWMKVSLLAFVDSDRPYSLNQFR
jgi:hypothetical protein